MLNADLKAQIIAIVQANQPVLAAKVSELLKKNYNVDLSPEDATAALMRMRTDFPKRTAKSGDRFSVIDLSD